MGVVVVLWGHIWVVICFCVWAFTVCLLSSRWERRVGGQTEIGASDFWDLRILRLYEWMKWFFGPAGGDWWQRIFMDLKRDVRVHSHNPKYPVVYNDVTRGTIIMDVAVISVRRLNVLAVNGDNRIVAFVCFGKTRVVDDRGMYLRRLNTTR